jgi:hypothetical protein
VTDTDHFKDAIDAYERAMRDAEYIRGAWIEAGRPLTQQSTNGLLGRHPLWRVMLEAETHAMRFRAELGLTPRSAKAVIRRERGRPPGAASSPDRVRLTGSEPGLAARTNQDRRFRGAELRRTMTLDPTLAPHRGDELDAAESHAIRRARSTN